MLKKSDCKSLSVRDMRRVVTFEKHSVNIALHKSPPEGSASEQKIKIFTFGFGAPWMGFMVEIGLETGIWTPPPSSLSLWDPLNLRPVADLEEGRLILKQSKH